RDFHVTGVQTCALPISHSAKKVTVHACVNTFMAFLPNSCALLGDDMDGELLLWNTPPRSTSAEPLRVGLIASSSSSPCSSFFARSEELRVGIVTSFWSI